MLSRTIAKLTAMVPTAVKYKLSSCKPLYISLLKAGQSTVTVGTSAGPIRWPINALTSQEFLLGTYEKYMQNAFRAFIRPGFTVYDIGAHAGFHSMFCGLLVGSSGRVIAFEPNPLNCSSIEGLIEANPGAPVDLHQLALSDISRTATFDSSPGSFEGSLRENGNVTVEARTIDSLVSAGQVPLPDLIKIDVEGHEEAVIRGGLAMIRKCKPIILCDQNDDSSFPALEHVLKPLGYQVFVGPPITAVPNDAKAFEGSLT